MKKEAVNTKKNIIIIFLVIILIALCFFYWHLNLKRNYLLNVSNSSISIDPTQWVAVDGLGRTLPNNIYVAPTSTSTPKSTLSPTSNPIPTPIVTSKPTITPSSTLSPTNKPNSYVKGDVNGDNKVSVIDYIQIRKFLLSKMSLDDKSKLRGDMNGDGKISSIDSNLIKNVILSAK